MAPQSPKSEYLIVLDDDATIQHLVGGFTEIRVIPFTTSQGLLSTAEHYSPLAVFVDIYLRDNDNGLDVVPSLHTIWPHVPIIVMTSNDSSDLIGQALACGACDFLKKPLNKAEVVARLRARLSEYDRLRNRTSVTFEGVTLDWIHQSLRHQEKSTHLSPASGAVLKLLMETPGHVVSKTEVQRAVWKGTKVSANTLDAKLSEIRKALRSLDAPIEIESHYGSGISLSAKINPPRSSD